MQSTPGKISSRSHSTLLSVLLIDNSNVYAYRSFLRPSAIASLLSTAVASLVCGSATSGIIIRPCVRCWESDRPYPTTQGRTQDHSRSRDLSRRSAIWIRGGGNLRHFRAQNLQILPHLPLRVERRAMACVNVLGYLKRPTKSLRRRATSRTRHHFSKRAQSSGNALGQKNNIQGV